MKIRKAVFAINAVLVFLVMGGLIVQKERILKSGQTVLLELAPVDPRSLLQGDYIALSYRLFQEIGWERVEQMPARGKIVVRLDQDHVGHFLRIHGGEPLLAGEMLLQYHRHGYDLSIGAESFFFQEGQAALYEKARYGELKVDAGGGSILRGVRDGQLQPLIPR